MKRPIFQPGQQVVCIDGEFQSVQAHQILNPHHPAVVVPEEGEIYTVRQLHIFPQNIGITLQEISNPPMGPLPEMSFDQERFAPVPPVEVVEVEEEEEITA